MIVATPSGVCHTVSSRRGCGLAAICAAARSSSTRRSASGGAATHPAWYRNLVKNPIVTIEHGDETFRARARTAEEPERTRLFDQQAALMPFFDGYRRRVRAREIPVVVFDRID